MKTNELLELSNSSDAPSDMDDFVIWLHNEIINKVRHELHTYREEKSLNVKSSYAACNHIFSFQSLQFADNI